MNTNEIYKMGEELKAAFAVFEKIFDSIDDSDNKKESDNEMIVYKKCKMMVWSSDIKVGDQIEVPLDGIGTFTATAHQITDEEILFIFDDCIACRQMNSKRAGLY